MWQCASHAPAGGVKAERGGADRGVVAGSRRAWAQGTLRVDRDRHRPRGGAGSAPFGGLLGGAAGSGALEGLVGKFKDAGAGEQADSWSPPERTSPSTPRQVVDALTPEGTIPDDDSLSKAAEKGRSRV